MKKTLIFFGAARIKGHTKRLLDIFCEHLEGDVEILDAYRIQYSDKAIAPCTDCRYCWRTRACSIKDSMTDIYQKIDDADNIIFASPMYFHSVTGPLKTIIDRLQVFWASHVRKDKPEHPLKKGGIIMVGGAPSFPNQFLAGEIVLAGTLKDIDAECLGTVCMPNSDHDSIDTHPEIREKLIAFAKKFN
ncbi:MAG: flavodoxin family protein [Brevinema sp.]